MKVIIENPLVPTLDIEYPIIKVHHYDVDIPDPLLVLFTSEDEGIVIATNAISRCGVGDTLASMVDTGYINLDDDTFIPFTGTVTLSNN